MRVIINGVVAGLAEHPRLAYLSQHRDMMCTGVRVNHGSIPSRRVKSVGLNLSLSLALPEHYLSLPSFTLSLWTS